MLEQFKDFLIKKGYSENTPSGNPSTVYDYVKRVERICNRENVATEHLAENIIYYVDKYDSLGSEADFGKKSHSAYINALKRFKEFKIAEFN